MLCAKVPVEALGLPTGMPRAVSPESKCVRKFSAGGRPTPRRSVRSGDRRTEPGGARGPRADTLYTAAGGMGRATMAALHHILAAQAGERSAMIVAATDAEVAGRQHAVRLKEFAVKARVRFAEILPPDGLNDAICSVSLRQ